MAIQSIDCRRPLPPIRVTKPDSSVSMFYLLAEDVPASSELVLLDFQAGDSVEVDPSITPTNEDVLMMQGADGTQVLVSFDESAGYGRMACLGVVVTHLRPWTERRRTEHQRSQMRQQQGLLSVALANLARTASSRLSSVMRSPGVLETLHFEVEPVSRS